MNKHSNDIERYLNGQMNSTEMHAFELAMMNDPFLAEAVDGYKAQWKNIQLQNDLSQLQEQLNVKEKKAAVIKGSFRQWMSIAASLIILLSVSVVLYRIFSSKESGSVKIDAEKKSTAPVIIKDEQAPTIVDSQTVAVNKKTVPVLKNPVSAVATTEQKNKKQLTDDTISAIASTATEKQSDEIKSTITTPPANPQAAGIAKKDNTNAVIYDKAPETKIPYLYKFSGRVVDENNNPLPFANIKEPVSGVGTYADVNGNFTMVSADSILNVEAKSVGYSTSLNQIITNREQKIILKDEMVIANAPGKENLYERNKKRITAMKTEVTEMETIEPESGWGFYNIYVANNLRETEMSGKKPSGDKLSEVLISFDVNPDGSVANFKVEKSTCKSCNQEAIRLIKEGPRWKSKTGKKERTRFSIQF